MKIPGGGCALMIFVGLSGPTMVICLAASVPCTPDIRNCQRSFSNVGRYYTEPFVLWRWLKHPLL